MTSGNKLVKWSSVASNPKFRALDRTTQETVRNEYFDQQVAPRAAAKGIDPNTIREDFDLQTGSIDTLYNNPRFFDADVETKRTMIRTNLENQGLQDRVAPLDVSNARNAALFGAPALGLEERVNQALTQYEQSPENQARKSAVWNAAMTTPGKGVAEAYSRLYDPNTPVENVFGGELLVKGLSKGLAGKTTGETVQNLRQNQNELDVAQEKTPGTFGYQGAAQALPYVAGGPVLGAGRGIVTQGLMNVAAAGAGGFVQGKIAPTSNQGLQETPEQAVSRSSSQSTTTGLTNAAVGTAVTSVPFVYKTYQEIKNGIGHYITSAFGSKTGGQEGVAKELLAQQELGNQITKNPETLADIETKVKGYKPVDGYSPTATGMSESRSVAALEEKARQANPAAALGRDVETGKVVEQKLKTGEKPSVDKNLLQQDASKRKEEIKTKIEAAQGTFDDVEKSINDELDVELNRLDNEQYNAETGIKSKSRNIEEQTVAALNPKGKPEEFATRGYKQFGDTKQTLYDAKNALYERFRNTPEVQAYRVSRDAVESVYNDATQKALAKGTVDKSALATILKDEKPDFSYEELDDLVKSVRGQLNNHYSALRDGGEGALDAVGVDALTTAQDRLIKMQEDIVGQIKAKNPNLAKQLVQPGEVSKAIGDLSRREVGVKPSGAKMTSETPIAQTFNDLRSGKLQPEEFFDGYITGKPTDKANVESLLNVYSPNKTLQAGIKDSGVDASKLASRADAEDALDNYLIAKISKESANDPKKLESVLQKYDAALSARPALKEELTGLKNDALAQAATKSNQKADLALQLDDLSVQYKNNAFNAKQTAKQKVDFQKGITKSVQRNLKKEAKSIPNLATKPGENIIKSVRRNPLKQDEIVTYADSVKGGRDALKQAEISETLDGMLDEKGVLNLSRAKALTDAEDLSFVEKLHGRDSEALKARQDFARIAEAEGQFNKLNPGTGGTDPIGKSGAARAVTGATVQASSLKSRTTAEFIGSLQKYLRTGYNRELVNTIFDPAKNLPEVLAVAKRIQETEAAINPTTQNLLQLSTKLSPAVITAIHNMVRDTEQKKPIVLPKSGKNETPDINNAPMPDAVRGKKKDSGEISSYSDTLKSVPEQHRDNAKLVADEANKAGIDVDFALALANAESEFKHKKSNSSNAYGIMQVMPDLAAKLAPMEDMYSPEGNVKVGIKFLKQIQDTAKSLFDSPSNGEVYSLYLLGETRGKRLAKYRNDKKTPVTSILPADVVKANKKFFINENTGKPFSVAKAYQNFEDFIRTKEL